MSTGIVSANGRSLPAKNSLIIDRIIQHTAPLNPGNSGGPLVSSSNIVVGINTAIIPRAQGIGFAVPASTAEWVVSELLRHGHVPRSQLGIHAITRELSVRELRAYDWAHATAISVESVEKGSAADKSGIRPSDLLLMIDGQPQKDVEDLFRCINRHSPTRELRVTLGRRGESILWSIAPDLRPR